MNKGVVMIIAFVLGFVIAQIIKTCVDILGGGFKRNNGNFGELIAYLTRSGGMPSGHTASLSAAIMYIGLWQGFESPVFLLGVCVLFVIIYDAINVRYSVGEQGKTLNAIIKRNKYNIDAVRVVEGHTILEVMAGLTIGILIGYVCFLVF